MRAIVKPYVIVMISMSILASCGEDSSKPTIYTPDSYEFYRDGISTVSFSGQTTRIDMASELINSMKDFEENSTHLIEMYANQTIDGFDTNPFNNPVLNESSKSVKSKVATSNDFFSSNTAESAEIKQQFEIWIEGQVNEVFPSENQLAAIGYAGQIADGTAVRYVNSKGIEYNQVVNKSLIGALMVDQIVNHYLSPTILDAGKNITNNNEGITDGEASYTAMEHKWDEAYGYLFGKSLNPSQPLSEVDEDDFLYKYLQSVDGDVDFTGIASDIFEAFKLGRAAIVAGEYTIRDQQAELIKLKLAEVIAIRSVYYLQQGKKELINSNFGGAFHDLSEGMGFVYSLRFLHQMNSDLPYFSQEEVTNYMNLLTEGNGFWDIETSALDAISESIASKFSFTVSQAASN